MIERRSFITGLIAFFVTPVAAKSYYVRRSGMVLLADSNGVLTEAGRKFLSPTKFSDVEWIILQPKRPYIITSADLTSADMLNFHRLALK